MKTQDRFEEEDAFNALDVLSHRVISMQLDRAANILQEHIQETGRHRIESFCAFE